MMGSHIIYQADVGQIQKPNVWHVLGFVEGRGEMLRVMSKGKPGSSKRGRQRWQAETNKKQEASIAHNCSHTPTENPALADLFFHKNTSSTLLRLSMHVVCPHGNQYFLQHSSSHSQWISLKLAPCCLVIYVRSSKPQGSVLMILQLGPCHIR